MTMRKAPRFGLSLMPSEDARIANEPLFEAGLIDALEWSIDFGFGGVPAWVEVLLERYAERGALYAHGVELSAMSAVWTADHDAWIGRAVAACQRHRYRHLTEHYGFTTAGDFVHGTPLPLPLSRAGLALAVDRFRMLADKTGLPVGVENLAFAFGRDDCLQQAELVSELCARANAFVLLDVHNLICQAENFGVDALALAKSYPLDRVREIHVAGGTYSGSVWDHEPRRFRRDSHEASTPEAAMLLLRGVIPLCEALDVVILERSDRSLFSTEEARAHHAEVKALREIVLGANHPPQRESAPLRGATSWVDDSAGDLGAYQAALLETFARIDEPLVARDSLAGDASASRYAEQIRAFEPRAVEVGIAMVRQWAMRKEPPDTMHAAVFSRPLMPLELRNLPIPVAGPGQVLVRVEAVGLCGTDVHAFEGRFPVPRPIVLGHEVVGVVEAIGPGVVHPRVGDRVGASWVQRGCMRCRTCNSGIIERCASARTWVENGGGLSELVVVEATGVTLLPDGVSFEESAPMFCGGHVAASAILRASPKQGERVAVLGLGGIGHLAVMIAAAWGHEVIAITSSPDKARDARALGASAAAVMANEDDAGDALSRVGGASVVISTTSSMRAATSVVRGLDAGGRLVVLGLGDGELVLDPIDLVQREIAVIGSIQGPREDLNKVLHMLARGAIRPRIESFPLLLAQRALQRVIDGRARYRVVVTP